RGPRLAASQDVGRRAAQLHGRGRGAPGYRGGERWRGAGERRGLTAHSAARSVRSARCAKIERAGGFRRPVLSRPHRLNATCPVLAGAHVRLEPLAREHAAGLTTAAARDPAPYVWSYIPQGLAHMAAYVEDALAARARAHRRAVRGRAARPPAGVRPHGA